jgi:hypothetical protein
VSIAPSLLFIGLVACAADRHAIRDDDTEKADLIERAGAYWDGVRWRDMSGPLGCIEDVDERQVWSSWFDGYQADFQVTEAEVISARVTASDPAVDVTTLRQGTVTVRVERIVQATQQVDVQTVEQSWYRTTGGWFLRWAP